MSNYNTEFETMNLKLENTHENADVSFINGRLNLNSVRPVEEVLVDLESIYKEAFESPVIWVTSSFFEEIILTIKQLYNK